MALMLAILAFTMIAPRAAHGQAFPTLPDTVRLQLPQLDLPAFLSPFPGRTGQGGYTVGQIGLKPIPLLVAIDFRAPTIVTGGPTPDLSRWVVARGATLIRRRMALARRTLYEPSAPARSLPVGALADAGLATGLADLEFEIVGQGELGGEWTRFRPCDTKVQFSCDPGLLPRLSPDIQFAVRAAGSITERITLDVDFDQAREFSAANNLNIFYRGDDDAVLRTVELGDVTFALPRSRFLTQGVPAGNFGVLVTGQAGPLDFRSVWAQQTGDVSSREFRLSGGPGQENFVQVDTLVLDDADYVRGQFFFLIDPAEIDGSPHIDVLGLDPSFVPLNVAPGVDPVQIYRFETDPVTRQQVDGLIQADAFATRDGLTVNESGWFRFLLPGVDYSIHSSGLWVALRRPLGPDEMLAVTYVSATGDTIGTYNPERVYNAGGRPSLKLLQASRANHRPGLPTWDQEMHQVYRVSSSPDVEPSSVGLSISLGELSAGRTFTRDLAGRDVTYLRLFGLDEESPVDVLDAGGLYQWSGEFLQEQPVVPGVFIFFPTLRPFQTPPPVPVLGLTATETEQILGSDGNPTIYEAEDPFLRESGGLYRLTIPFELRSRGVISSFSLGALGIRDGSERVFLGDRLLVRDIDYTIDNAIGQVTLTQPEALFATASEPVVRVSWEQKAIFQVTPTSVFGFNGRVQAGRFGEFNLLALRQSEQALVNRPQLGTEAAAITLTGLSMDFDFPARGLDRFLDRIPALRVGRPSRIALQGEVALSLPNPNIRADVFLDDFDASNELNLSLDTPDWFLGSAPAFRDGAEGVLPVAVDQSRAGGLVWQHTWVIRGSGQDSVGVFAGFLPEVDVDKQINVIGSQARESGMVLTFTPSSSSPSEPSWRSITTSLSATGMDLSKTESLEFYAADGDSLTLIIDLGVTGEDALFIDAQGRTAGVKGNGTPWGLGRLDHEADPRLGEVWSDDADQRGVWGETCQAKAGTVYDLGDRRANCTRGNGVQDSEDLDGDGNLDNLERYIRFVVRLDGSSPFLVRNQSETGTEFQLYRIPLRGADVTEVPGAFSEADFRAVKHMRMTVAGRLAQSVTLFRMRLVGAHWVKRTDSGVLDGIVGDTASFLGRLEVGPVSSVTEGDAYQAPPGVIEELDDPSAAFGGLGREFNEKGLKLEYEGVQPGSRAEVFNRFPQRPRDFLSYRELKIWALARTGDWGATVPVSFFVKVGEDAENFYLYRTRLEPVPNPGMVTPGDWLPEIVIDFGQWIDLRRQAEESLIFDPRDPSDPPLELWAQDSTYAIVLKDRARAPNLAAVRELSMGIWNEAGFPTTGEVWINEMRLSSPLRDAGFASHLALDIEASDVWTTHLAVRSRGALFRQLVENPTFQGDRIINLGSTFNLDRLAPADWGVEIPVTVTHVRSDRDPRFLAGSDIRADNVVNLRESGSRRTRIDVAFRKRTPAANPVIGLLLDGLEARAGYFTSSSTTIAAEGAARGVDGHLGYGRAVGRRDFGIVPGFLKPVLRWLLPRSWEDAVMDSRFRWSPERLSFGASYAATSQQALRFDHILVQDSDSLVRPTRSPRESLEGAFEIVFRPFQTFSAQADIVTVRDLLNPKKTVVDPAVQDLLSNERFNLLGVDLGWETDKVVRTRMDFEPRFGDWIRTALGWQSFYTSHRTGTFVERSLDLVGDTVVGLVRNVDGGRDFTGQITVIPATLVGASDTIPLGGSVSRRGVRALMNAIDPITVTYQSGVTSRFDRDPVNPQFFYRYGLVGRDGYAALGADTATTFTDRAAWTVRSNVRLPAGFRVGVNYRLTTANTLDTRSDRTLRRETWPDVNLSLASLPLPDQGLIRRVSLSAGFQRIRQKTAFGGLGLQKRFQRDERIPVEIALVWVGGLSTSYRGSFTTGEGGDPTGETERKRENHTVSVTGSMRPPFGLAARLTRPITISALLQYASDRNCRSTATRPECVPFLDELIRSLIFRVESAVSRMDVRLQLSYTDRRSFVGLRSGSSQFQFGLFGRFVIADDALLR
ncbi:MAG: hypothetical protein IIC36_05625 [Gemmatimonadetes bacterium]|nr:hypothetical protein [Gemmatimonadota bacterium]